MATTISRSLALALVGSFGCIERPDDTGDSGVVAVDDTGSGARVAWLQGTAAVEPAASWTGSHGLQVSWEYGEDALLCAWEADDTQAEPAEPCPSCEFAFAITHGEPAAIEGDGCDALADEGWLALFEGGWTMGYEHTGGDGIGGSGQLWWSIDDAWGVVPEATAWWTASDANSGTLDYLIWLGVEPL